MIVKTSDIDTIKPFLEKFRLPEPYSHKGQNGKVMIIGGSSLFHSAIIWSAEIASYFVDMVHVGTTQGNSEIITSIKKKWQNGIVIPFNQVETYVSEDDVVLMGTGIMREGKEGEFARALTKKLFEKFPDKKWVIDAGSLQIMDKEWLLNLKTKPILTPHQREFQQLFGINIIELAREEKMRAVESIAKKYHCILLVKEGFDIATDGNETAIIEGGNAGLTKGGTGDILAALTACFCTKHDGVTSAVLASYLLKKTADVLYEKKGYWFNNTDLISTIPFVLNSLMRQYKHIG